MPNLWKSEMMQNIILFCGSRGLERSSQIMDVITEELGELNSESTIIIHGGASGIDTLVDEIATYMKFKIIIYKPKYQIYGKKAPLIRNQEMVDIANKVIAIWNGRSHGTLYTINQAKKAGKQIKIYLFKDSKISLIEVS